MTKKKGIAILGSTGSIGTQALEVIESYPDVFDLQVLTANGNADLLIEQAKKFRLRWICNPAALSSTFSFIIIAK